MTVYVIAMVSVDDPETYKKYVVQVPPIVARHGGKYLARGGEVTTLEGEPYQDRLVILEFPSAQDARNWLDDPEYVSAVAIRHASSTGTLLMVDAVV